MVQRSIQKSHEISYSIVVLEWFKKKSTITKILPIDNLIIQPKLFDDNLKNYNNLGMKELMLALNLVTQEGGLFTIIAKK